MKKLKVIKDPENLDGFCEISYDRKNYEIAVNIEKIWKRSLTKKDPERYFIKTFAKTYAHELIHVLIRQCMPDYDFIETGLVEEKAIYKLLNERWNKKLNKFYS